MQGADTIQVIGNKLGLTLCYAVKQIMHLSVMHINVIHPTLIMDSGPSHMTGRRHKIPPLTPCSTD